MGKITNNFKNWKSRKSSNESVLYPIIELVNKYSKDVLNLIKSSKSITAIYWVENSSLLINKLFERPGLKVQINTQKYKNLKSLKEKIDMKFTQYKESSRENVIKNINDHHNKYLSEILAEYKRLHDIAQYVDDDLWTDDVHVLLFCRENAHCFYNFCINIYGLKFDTKLIKQLKTIDDIIITIVKSKEKILPVDWNGKYPNSHWWWHLHELDKLSKKDLETI